MGQEGGLQVEEPFVNEFIDADEIGQEVPEPYEEYKRNPSPVREGAQSQNKNDKSQLDVSKGKASKPPVIFPETQLDEYRKMKRRLLNPIFDDIDAEPSTIDKTPVVDSFDMTVLKTQT